MEDKVKVLVKKFNGDAVLPNRQHESDAGFDLTVHSAKFDDVHNIVEYGTGIGISMPKGYVGMIFPRSSIYKTKLVLSNCVGIIDSGYTGEIKFKFYIDKLDRDAIIYKVGDRCGQLIIMKYPDVEYEEVKELPDTDRGDGGFGSTGK